MDNKLNGMVKRIRKTMRKDNGVDGDAQRINQLVWMLFLKVYDELKESNEYELTVDGYTSIIPEKYRWRNWAIDHKDGKAMTGDELVKFINSDLFPTLAGLRIDENTPPRSAIVQRVFSRLHNYMINGTLIREVINELNDSINFDEYEDRHFFNDIYESILKELQSAGSSGEFYTPRPVTDFMAEMTDPKAGEKVADFACGTGGFLVSSINHVLAGDNSQAALESIQRNIIGQESKPLPYLLCVTNMLLHDLDGSQITYGSSLAKNVTEYTISDQCDVILMNPPFGGEIAPGEDSNFPASYRTSETANLFVCLVLCRLKQHGRVGIILPDGFLFGNDDASVKLKEKLLKECNLHTIVKLPSGLFYANITTNILFFEKGRKTEGIWYYQVPLPEGYKSFSKTKPFKAEHLDDCRQWWHSRETENPNAWYVSFDQIYKRNYDLDVKNPNAKADPASEMTLAEILDEMSHESQTIAENLSKIKELLKDVSDD